VVLVKKFLGQHHPVRSIKGCCAILRDIFLMSRPESAVDPPSMLTPPHQQALTYLTQFSAMPSRLFPSLLKRLNLIVR
jgi:hypothetical protein